MQVENGQVFTVSSTGGISPGSGGVVWRHNNYALKISHSSTSRVRFLPFGNFYGASDPEVDGQKKLLKASCCSGDPAISKMLTGPCDTDHRMILKVSVPELDLQTEPLAPDLNIWTGGEGCFEARQGSWRSFGPILSLDQRRGPKQSLVQLFELRDGSKVLLTDAKGCVMRYLFQNGRLLIGSAIPQDVCDGISAYLMGGKFPRNERAYTWGSRVLESFGLGLCLPAEVQRRYNR